MARPSTAPPAVRLGRGPIEILGKVYFKTRQGKLIELPSDITYEEAVALEAEAVAAEAKLGKGPPPQPVPDVKKLVKKEDKKEKLKLPGKGSKARRGKGKVSPKAGAAAAAMLKAVGKSKVAQYLAAKAAPVMQKGFGKLQTLSKNEQTHDDAAEKRVQAEGAVVIPDSEGQSKSNTGQVGMVSGRPAPPVDEAKGKQTLQTSLRENVPRKIEDVDNFRRDQKAQHMGADVMKVVLQDKNAVVSTFQDMRQTPPPAPREFEPVDLPPQETAPPTAPMNLGKDAIAPLQKEHTDVSNFTKDADKKLQEEGVTQEQLDMVDSGDLASANKEKKGMEVAAKTEPVAVQKFAQQQTEKVDKDLKQQENTQRVSMKAKRKAGLNATSEKQKKQKSNLEKRREEVAAKINGIYTTAQDKVKKRLADLETEAIKRFDDGNAKATKKFEDDVNRELAEFKADRYSGWFGWARKLRDWWKGMDDLPAVKEIFERNKAIFVSTINKLVEDISAENKRVIQECKDELQNARNQITVFVDKLEPSLKDIGKKSAEEMNSKLAEMDKFIAKKEEDLQNQLKDKQTAAIKAIDEKIEKMKEAMAGALAKLGKLLLWAAKKFFTWALTKFGYSLEEIEGIINRGAAVLKAIFTQPIRFVKNLMKAAVLGFENFGKNFLKHLKDALFEWLTGSLQGIKLPSTWDLRGVLSVAFQMIGITYANLRRHMVDVMGEKVVSGLESTFKLVQTLVVEGPMAAWEQLKDIAVEMQDAFINAVKDFIKWKIIEEAIKWVVSLFIPGAGIVRAVIGIYDTVVFFIKKAKQIMQMISNFLSSIGEIAAGNIGAAADAMEKGLARGLSLVISFLAALLRLGGITNKIRDAIQKIKDKVDAVLLKVAKWVADKAKVVINKGVATAKAGAAKVLQWWRARSKFTADDGEHTLSVEGTPQQPFVQIASVPQSLREYLTSKLTKTQMKTIEPYISAVEKQANKISPNEKPEAAQKRVQETLDKLKDQLKGMLTFPVPPTVVVHKPSSNLATRVVARPLTKLAGNTTPSDVRDSLKSYPPARKGQVLMNQLNSGQVGGTGWSRLHLLSYRLMGPDQWWNLTPGDAKANADMTKVELATEKFLKGSTLKEIGGKRRRTFIRFYDVTASYQQVTSPKGANQFADTIKIREGIYDPLTEEELDVKTPGITPSSKPLPPGAARKPNYSEMGGPALNLLLAGIPHPNGGSFPKTIGELIVKARTAMDKATGDRFFSYERLREHGTGLITQEDIEGLIQLVRDKDAEIK